MPKISVVVPSYNQGCVLRRTLESLYSQGVSKEDFEIIIVDDASTDDTYHVVSRFLKDDKAGFLSYKKNRENSGSARTRNKGLKLAKSNLVLFIDADNVLDPDCLSQHLSFHRRYPQNHVAVQGYSRSPKDIELDPIKMLDDVTSPLDKLKHGDFCSWEKFSSMHISFKKDFIKEGFDETLFDKMIGFEDNEFAFRLAKKGLKIILNKKAVAYHYHFRTPEEFLNKVYRYGKAFCNWIAKDESFGKEKKYINSYLPYYCGAISLKGIKYSLQRLLINENTIDSIKSLAKRSEKNNKTLSVFIYKRLYNYYFMKGYNEFKQKQEE